jgi:hypothetical protein
LVVEEERGREEVERGRERGRGEERKGPFDK